MADGRTEYKCCPPIRDAANRDALWQALVDGLVDCVVSDHSPSTADLKCLDTGDFGEAWGGIASLQLGLSLDWTAAARPRASGCRRRSCVDVDRAGGPGRTARARARSRWAGTPTWSSSPPTRRSPSTPRGCTTATPVTPYAGAELTGVVRDVWLRGRPVVDAWHGGRRTRTADC